MRTSKQLRKNDKDFETKLIILLQNNLLLLANIEATRFRLIVNLVPFRSSLKEDSKYNLYLMSYFNKNPIDLFSFIA